MFGRDGRRALGLLAGDALAVSRGELLGVGRRAGPQPHHQVCPVCGFTRWDGRSEHPRRGAKFARRLCFGQTRETVEAARAATGPPSPLVDELLQFASGAPGDQPLDDPTHFQIVGSARDR